jgi:alginate O-acetyltransferase complex protein AlgI
MLFTSLTFFVFLAATWAGFLLLPRLWRGPWLLAASLVFYASFGAANLGFLVSVTMVAWLTGSGIARTASAAARRAVLTVGLFLILGSLVALKFHDFAASEAERLFGVEGLPRLGLTAPAGFSFYAFMAAAYVIDVHRRVAAVETGLLRFGLYLAWFPKILAGPIERAPAFLRQIPNRLRLNPVLATAGLQLILWGLFKKVVIADNLSPVVDAAFRIAPYAAPMELAIAIYFFAFQIYCDFSGYSDMAIGLSLLFGIRLMENFRRPYLAVTTTEFWSSRWHISLGHWFRDYLYVPMGGSRVGIVRRYANVMAVFLVSGLWHAGLGYGVGWTFLVWGALNGFYQWAALATRGFWRALGALLPMVASSGGWRIARIVLTFHLVLVSWVFFRADTIEQALTVLARIWNGLPTLPGLLATYPFSFDHKLGAALIVFLVAFEVLDERRPMALRLAAAPRAVRWAVYYAGLFALVVLGRWGTGQFIYMQF